mmetsp:Transcript_24349/g.57854  ORF Transcript_24349/g.57854 Transcript_24349/m.57854 type:complete len:284 (+) Transcript_24349:243-1094(+)
MALIEAYEEQYAALYKDINEKLDRLTKLEKQGGSTNDRWGSTLSGARQDIEDVDEVLSKLNMEIRSLKGDAKASVQSRLQKYKIDTGVCKETLQSLQRRGEKAGTEKERSDLLGDREKGGVGIDPKGASSDHRTRMQATSQRLEDSTERVKESRKTARDTEMVGQDIISELRQQRETLLHARDGVREVDQNLGESRRLVKVMQKRMQQNKCFMWAVVAVVAIIIITIVFMSLQPSAPSLNDPPPTPLPGTPGMPSDPDPPPLIDPAKDGVKPGGARRRVLRRA